MNKKIIIMLSIFAVSISSIGVVFSVLKKSSHEKTSEIIGTVMKYNGSSVTIKDENLDLYTLNFKSTDFDVGDYLAIEYTGILKKDGKIQSCEVINYTVLEEETNKDGIPVSWLDNGIFSSYYKAAFEKLQSLTLDEKIGQLLLVRYPNDNQIEALKKYKFSGFVFFEKDFKNKTEKVVKQTMNTLQDNANIPLLTAVDEEGGDVVRVSSNPNLVSEKYKSPSELYELGGFDKIKEDTIDKSRTLYNLGLNLNLAPVVDVSTDSSDYIYERSLKKDTELTSRYAKTVIEASKRTGVSYTLKHFPGYGNNEDSHKDSVVDDREYDDIKKNDLPPFEEGIKAGAESIMISHNVVTNIDSDNPASLSIDVHNLLRDDLGFTGVIIADDIAMGALDSIDDVAVKAILAGNDLIITTDFSDSFDSIKDAIEDESLSEKQIDKSVFRILAWKYSKGLISLNQK